MIPKIHLQVLRIIQSTVRMAREHGLLDDVEFHGLFLLSLSEKIDRCEKELLAAKEKT